MGCSERKTKGEMLQDGVYTHVPKIVQQTGIPLNNISAALIYLKDTSEHVFTEVPDYRFEGP